MKLNVSMNFIITLFISQVDVDDKPQVSPFSGIISQCFEHHLNIYIDSQDR